MNDNQPANGIKIGNEKLIKVTENAARRLSSLLEKQGRPQGALRLAVIGGGCSGLQYKMDLVEGPAPRDILVQFGRKSLFFFFGCHCPLRLRPLGSGALQ